MSTENPRQELLDVISTDVKAGFASKKEIIEAGIDYLLGDYDYDTIETWACELAEQAFAEHYNEQAKWVGETDCDRLSEAFAELDNAGIVARMNFTCCQTCGHAEIAYPIEEYENAGRKPRGYVFFHWQDTESAVRNGYLYMAYGSISGNENESTAIAREVCDTLKRHGLEADWNGSVRTRICIREINWRYRRVAEGSE